MFLKLTYKYNKLLYHFIKNSSPMVHRYKFNEIFVILLNVETIKICNFFFQFKILLENLSNIERIYLTTKSKFILILIDSFVHLKYYCGIRW